MTATVSNDSELSRYEVRQDGALAGYAQYTRTDTEITFTHTSTDPAFAGQGLAKVLAAAALDDARSQGLSVIPQCTFFSGFISKNPEYLELVPDSRRAEFDLV